MGFCLWEETDWLWFRVFALFTPYPPYPHLWWCNNAPCSSWAVCMWCVVCCVLEEGSTALTGKGAENNTPCYCSSWLHDDDCVSTQYNRQQQQGHCREVTVCGGVGAPQGVAGGGGVGRTVSNLKLWFLVASKKACTSVRPELFRDGVAPGGCLLGFLAIFVPLFTLILPADCCASGAWRHTHSGCSTTPHCAQPTLPAPLLPQAALTPATTLHTQLAMCAL